MNCLFCDIAKKKINSNIIYEDDLVIVILDLHPVVDAHSLILPKKHYETYKDLDEAIIIHMHKVTKKMEELFFEKLKVFSMSALFNYGTSQVIKHFHLHLLPNHPSKTKLSIDEVYNLLTGENET